ncbi:hypothetical protein NKR19_g9805 [Coniochaeta hoffmannii]|uniref:Uncharacterized protein n=1 Tax=Coniochaeta hoffmannii TaxID=91930 RepID=A0AA38VJ27_9PEZI|nr:hypothetical protein NKR19_g9805 [Coniochaeta hoffmannii]
MERVRQMDAIEETIDDLETQIYLLDNETVTTWKNSNSTKAERNRQKTKAWLNATFARNFLLGYKSLLFKMRKHIDEFPHLVNHLLAQRGFTKKRYIGHHDPTSRDIVFGKTPEMPWAWGAMGAVNNQPHHVYDSGISSQCWSEDETLTLEPEMILYDADGYHETIHQAGMRMRDRLIAMIEEYDDKIRDFTMRIDNMAMATQWSQGETNMEIATSSAEDSSQMRSIALVTMVFLPGTFFASIFSMTFFNWTPDSTDGNHAPIISEKIWIYFLVTGLFTLLTLTLFWYFVLHRQRVRRRLPRVDDCPV